MINRRVTGIGCYAKPAKLSRVFKKMVRNYTLGQFETINPANSQDMAGGVDGTIMLKALISGNAGYFPAAVSEPCGVAENRKITGFFLTFRNKGLNLSIFARGVRNIQQTYTTRLDGFTELRQKRLN
jgi:hypothetical protein